MPVLWIAGKENTQAFSLFTIHNHHAHEPSPECMGKSATVKDS